MTTTVPAPSDARALIGVPLGLLAHAAVIFAVVQSPYGSLGFFDDSPSTTDWAVPMVAGVLIGLLQGLAFSWRVSLVSSALTLLAGFLTVLFLYPTASCATGSALGAGVVAVLNRWGRLRAWNLPAMVLVAVSLAAAVYGFADHSPEPLPSVEVQKSTDGPAVLVDVEERMKSTYATGTIADVDGCLGLVGASVGDGTVLVLWPVGTSVSSDPFTVTTGEKTYGLGDRVTLPGGGLLTRDVDLDAYRPDLPTSCRGRDLFL